MSDQNPNGSRQQPHWRHIYFLLVSFNLAALFFSLWLTSSVMRELDKDTETNYSLNTLIDEIINLQRLSTTLTKPATTIFASDDAPLEQRLFNVEKQRLERHFNDLANHIDTRLKSQADKAMLHEWLNNFRAESLQLVTLVQQVIDRYAEGDLVAAATINSSATETLHSANYHLNKLRADINDWQNNNFATANNTIKQVKQYNALIFLLAFVLTAAVFIYGNLLTRKLRKDDAEKHALLLATHDNALILETILESTVDGIITYDNHGLIVSANKAAEQIFNLTRDELKGSSVLKLLSNEKHEKYQKALQDELNSQDETSVIGLRVEAKHANGKTFPIAVSIRSREHTEADGSQQRLFTAIIRDITKEHEQKLTLEQALRHAKSASIAKDEFLATVSHEIRTPMNGILGASELLYNTDMENGQKELVDVIHNSCNGLLGIINDILEFTRIQSGTIELESIPFDAHAVLEDVYQLLKYRAEKQGLEFTLEGQQGDQFNFLGDPTRLRQILLNIINNAIKFTDTGGVYVYHQVDNQDEQLLWRCKVKDTGIGIAPDKIGKLFERFSQADSTITRTRGGTGLGLAISQQLSQIMGGKITVTSEQGKGSEFVIELPFQPTQPVARKPQGKRPKRNYGITALLVEDNQVNQLIATRLLSTFGLTVTVASNGQEALEKLNKQRFDVVFMDMPMPVMDGITATHAIRAVETLFTQVPIVAMTANALDKDRHQCLEAGMNDFISKPLEPSLIVAVLDKLFINETTEPS